MTILSIANSSSGFSAGSRSADSARQTSQSKRKVLDKELEYRSSDDKRASDGSDDLDANIRVQTDWGSGSQIVLQITNTGKSEYKGGWEVEFDLNPDLIKEAWNGSWSEARDGKGISVSDVGWNGALKPGQTVEVGFNLNAGGINEAQLNQEADFKFVTTAIKQLVYFGDSLTDQGNLSDLVGKVLAVNFPASASGYESGTFSDGPTYATYASDLLDATNTQNFAVASARAAGVRTVGEVIEANGLNRSLVTNPDGQVLNTNINISAQVDRYLASGPISDGTAVSLLIGLNDYGNFVPTSPDKVKEEIGDLIQNVVGETITAAARLAAAGAETIILNTLPTTGFFPAAQSSTPEQRAFGAQVIRTHNEKLKAAASSLNADVKIVDLETLSFEIKDDPETFGLIAPLAEPAMAFDNDLNPANDANPKTAGYDADQIAFFDPLHPTTATHGVIGSFQAASLTHETKFGMQRGEIIGGTAKGDLIFGRGGNDKISSGKADDIVFGGTGNDSISGGQGNDILSGGSGNDTLKGNSGADILAGGHGNDKLIGNAGDDVFVDGLGSDKANGGGGDDAFLYVQASLIGGQDGIDKDIFSGGAGNDTLYLFVDDSIRSSIEDQVKNGEFSALQTIGVRVTSIENIVFVDKRIDLAEIATPAPLGEADLWGLV